MPAGKPALVSSEEVLEFRKVSGISFHKEGDGVIFFYDAPLIYVAWYRGHMVVATVTDDGYEGPRERATGWKQTLLVETSPEFLMRVYDSEIPLRALYEQPSTRAWFVHEDWSHRGDRTWDRSIQVFDGFEVPDSMKPAPGVHLDPLKADAHSAS